jgi:hypothetical protein
MLKADMVEALSKCSDFANQKNEVEELCARTRGFDVVCRYFPLFHPELNPIEMYWAELKRFLRMNCRSVVLWLRNQLLFEVHLAPLPRAGGAGFGLWCLLRNGAPTLRTHSVSLSLLSPTLLHFRRYEAAYRQQVEAKHAGDVVRYAHSQTHPPRSHRKVASEGTSILAVYDTLDKGKMLEQSACQCCDCGGQDPCTRELCRTHGVGVDVDLMVTTKLRNKDNWDWLHNFTSPNDQLAWNPHNPTSRNCRCMVCERARIRARSSLAE